MFNDLSCWPNVAVILNLDAKKATVSEMTRGLNDRGRNPRSWIVIKKEEAPVKQIILKGDEADFFHLPSTAKTQEMRALDGSRGLPSQRTRPRDGIIVPGIDTLFTCPQNHR